MRPWWWWPWIHRRKLEDEQITASLLRQRIRTLESDLEDLKLHLDRELMTRADALDHGFRLARGEPYPGSQVGPYPNGEPLGGG